MEKIYVKVQKNSKFLFKSSDVNVNPSTTLNIQNRFKETMTKQTPWSPKEINLLKKLNRDIGGNCSILSSYFEKMSVLSVYKKSLKLYKKKEITHKPYIGEKGKVEKEL